MRAYGVHFAALCALAVLALSSSSVSAKAIGRIGTVRKHGRTVKAANTPGQHGFQSKYAQLAKRGHTHPSSHAQVQCKPKTDLLDIGMETLDNIDGEDSNDNHDHSHTHFSKSCFPALDFQMPKNPPSSLKNWWCNPDDEYAFMGFSYEITACQSQDQLTKEFKDARNTFKSRYIRLYGACDQKNYYDKVVEAAWEAGLGVQALIWFGFDGTDQWKHRRDELVQTLQSNPKAKYITRGIQFGSEPLFDDVLPPKQLADEVRKLQQKVHPMGINVTVSDLAYGFQSKMDDGAQDLLDQVDFVDVHMLPYFAQNASTGNKGFLNDVGDQAYMSQHACGKKIYWSENGWPSEHKCPGVCPNSKDAVSDVQNEKEYFDTLDKNCQYMRENGVGWFAHIYSDSQEPGYGIYDYNMKPKFNFHPKTECENNGGDDDDDSHDKHQHPHQHKNPPSQRRSLRRLR